MDASSRDIGGGDNVSTEGSSDPMYLQSNPAKTTTEFLAGLWELIAQANPMVRGVRRQQINLSFLC
jgi:hypothetical protein